MSTISKQKLARLNSEQLLKLKISQLPLTIKNSELEPRVAELYQDLKIKNLKFLPECYLADEWLTPDREPVIGIPFYLANPRLKELEQKMVGEVEGGSISYCMKLLRHEAGHAYNYAYRFYRRKRWKELFGNFSREYPEKYRFRPYSKRFVRHLDNWYAQCHPDEDFAETFAVWLSPKTNWQNHYRGWGAMAKLTYVDQLMQEIAEKPPAVKKGKKYWQASKIGQTLEKHYQKKQKAYASEAANFHDPSLLAIFQAVEKCNKEKSAAFFIRQNKSLICASLARFTGERKFVILKLLKSLIVRTAELKLALRFSREETFLKLTAYLTTIVMHYLYTGDFAKRR